MKAKLQMSKNNWVSCHLCWNLCEIKEGERGICNTRYNEGGILKTLTYGNLSAVESRPVEIKPFFHFLPGTTSITFSTYSCNLNCPWCQNWHLSKTPPPDNFRVIKPEKIVELAFRNGDKSTCASFNEPTLLFEFLIDLFPIARKHSLLNTIVSNGFMTPKALKMLIEAGLDAVNFDIKGNDRLYAEISDGKSCYIWKNAKHAVKKGIHVEMVFLLSPPVYRSPDIVDEVIDMHLRYVGEEIPMHFTRYFPAFMSEEPPTPLDFMESAVDRARRAGISYVYVGNVRHRFENTFCPECGKALILRSGSRMLENRLVVDDSAKCPYCGRIIEGIFE
jgi:pyruvate formate lyase activating enzyme